MKQDFWETESDQSDVLLKLWKLRFISYHHGISTEKEHFC